MHFIIPLNAYKWQVLHHIISHKGNKSITMNLEIMEVIVFLVYFFTQNDNFPITYDIMFRANYVYLPFLYPVFIICVVLWLRTALFY